MAFLYRTDGTIDRVAPGNGVHWSLRELQTLVGGYVEVVGTVDGRFMAIDEEGKLKHKPLNEAATRLYVHGRRDVIAGEALIVDSRLELDGPEEPEEPEE